MVIGVVLLAGCTTASVSPVSKATASPSASDEVSAPKGQCAHSNLRVAITGGGPGSGSAIFTITFTNAGPGVCELRGAPTVSVVKGGEEIGRPARQLGSSMPPVVRLQPGSAAVATLTAVNVDPDGGRLGEACHLAYGTGYAIFPPHSRHPVLIPTAERVPACTGNTGWFTVSPVRAP